mgnify:CR=1 FL=1|jgi:hypothetical protein
MKSVFFGLLALFFAVNVTYCQEPISDSEYIHSITPLKNNTCEIKEFTKDSLLIYKDVLSSTDPDIQHGRSNFFNMNGGILASPRWTPGKLKGEPVAALFTFPINFIID